MSDNQDKKVSQEGLASIIMIGVVCIVCILACAGIWITFLLNPPW